MAACSGIHPKTYFTSKVKVHPKLGKGKELPIKIVFPKIGRAHV